MGYSNLHMERKMQHVNITNYTYVANNGKTCRYPASDILLGTLQQMHPIDAMQVIAEYLQEAPHGEWEGFSSRDVNAFNRLFFDIALYAQASCNFDQHVIAYKEQKVVQYMQDTQP